MAAQDDGTTLQVGGVACSGGRGARHAWPVAHSVMVGMHASTNRVHAAEAFACAYVLTLHGACKWTMAS